jgi:lipopolysaccharide transport system ATP-binding protein
MYMRLAFSVAAHLETEILVVDEVLAVGDAAFQRKCLGKMDDVSRHGRTVLFVSHNLEAIQRLCTRALLFEQGRLVADGPIGRVVSQYRSADRAAAGAGRFSARARRGTGWALVRDLALVDETGRAVASRAADADLVFQIDLELVDAARAGGSLRGLIVELVVCTDDGRPLVSLMSADDTGVELPPASSCRLRVRLTAPTFVPGRYRVQVFLGVPNLEHVDEIPDALELEIEAPVRPWRPYELYATRGVVCRHADWGCEVTDMPVAGQ